MTEAKALAVIIPARNEADALRETLPALAKALEHLAIPSRIFLVDDESDDQTASVAASLGARVVTGHSRGPGAARNQGAHEALAWMEAMGADVRGWFLFLDADCRVTEDHFSQMAWHLHDPGVTLVSVQERPNLPREWLRLGDRLRRSTQRWSAARWGIPIVHAGCLYVRTPEFMRVGGFNHEHLFEDIELGFRFDPAEVRVLGDPPVVEISDRRVQRIGVLASLVVPARCAGVMFISNWLEGSRLASWFLAAFLKLGNDRLPAHLWWSDPERRLHASFGAAFAVTTLWWLVLFGLWTGALKRQRQPRLIPISELADRQAG